MSVQRILDPAADAAVARADVQDGHYEADQDQMVRVNHQVKPDVLPTQGPAVDVDRPHGTSVEEVWITPEAASVWEASPPDDA